MSLLTKKSKKTLVNQLNVDGSSDTRRLNSDIIGNASYRFTSTPWEDPGVINLGSSTNRWGTVYADMIYPNLARIPLTRVENGAPSGSPASTYQGINWYIDGTTSTARRVYWWNGSSWIEATTSTTPPLEIGQVWIEYGTTGNDRRFLIFNGTNVKRGFQMTDLITV